MTPFWIVTAAKRLEKTNVWQPYSTPAMNGYSGAQLAAALMKQQPDKFADVSVVGPLYIKLPKEK